MQQPAAAVQQRSEGLRQELQLLVDSAQQVVRQWPSASTEAAGPAPTSPGTLQAGSSQEAVTPAAQRQRKPEAHQQAQADKYLPYDLLQRLPHGQGDAADGGAGSAAADEESEGEGDDDELVDDAPKGRLITPLEAALAAYRQQKRQINKVGIHSL